MLKILIVDDEILVRMGLKLSIEWESHGFTIIGEAPDGVTALEIIKKKQPDIVLTDIKMPKMSGLELLQQINKIDRKIKVIILSNHNDFTYAQEAIQLGAVNYLIKVDIDPETLISTLNQVKEKYFSHDYIQNSMAGENELNVQKYTLLETLLDDETDFDTLQKSIDDLHINIHPKNIILIVIQADIKSASRNQSSYKNQLLYNSALELIEDCIRSQCKGEVTPTSKNRFVIIASLDNCSRKQEIIHLSQRIVEYIMESLKNILSISSSAGISDIHQLYTDIPAAYRESDKAIRTCFFEGQGTIVRYKDIEKLENIDAYDNNLNHNQIIIAISENDYSTIYQIMKNAEAYFIKNNLDTQKVRRYFIRILLEYIDYIKSLGGNQNEVFETSVSPIEKLMQFETLEQLEEYFLFITKRLLQYSSNHLSNQSNLLITKAIKYISDNYNKDFSLSDIAEFLGINHTYFSKLFKQKQGEGFVEFLTRTRIEQSKKLLANANLKTFQIAYAVGYQNAEYFSKIFKKQTGLSPKQYRNNLKKLNKIS
jgi:two-component system, response regulator YesN